MGWLEVLIATTIAFGGNGKANEPVKRLYEIPISSVVAKPYNVPLNDKPEIPVYKGNLYSALPPEEDVTSRLKSIYKESEKRT